MDVWSFVEGKCSEVLCSLLGIQSVAEVVSIDRLSCLGFWNVNVDIIPNTAVFDPTNFIGTTTTIATARMKILDEDF